MIDGGKNGAFLIVTGIGVFMFAKILLAFGPAILPIFAALMVAAVSLVLAGMYLFYGNLEACTFFLGVAFASLSLALGLLKIISPKLLIPLQLLVFGGGASVLGGKVCSDD